MGGVARHKLLYKGRRLHFYCRLSCTIQVHISTDTVVGGLRGGGVSISVSPVRYSSYVANIGTLSGPREDDQNRT